MAGNYPDYPSWRMAYDRDGTQVFHWTTGAPTQFTDTQVRSINDESNGDALTWSDNVNIKICFIFPELRDLDAYIVDFNGNSTISVGNCEVSVDTTNGQDGTWTSLGAAVNRDIQSSDRRSAIQSSTALAIRAVRFNFSVAIQGTYAGLGGVHLFGEIAPNENPHRLSIVKDSVDAHVDPNKFDWGNVPRSSTADKVFRVKNLSPTMTAGAIRVALEALTDTTPSTPGQHLLSYNGGSFLAQINIGDLAPGAISGPITLRRVTPSDAVLGLWDLRVFAETTTPWV